MNSDATGLTTRADAQDTFVGLLTSPLVSARLQPARFTAILRHRAKLMEWTGRLGYRLVISGTVARLHRDPSGPMRSASPPAMDPPTRRTLVLTALIAAACEGTDATTTVQVLSDEVRALSVSPGARITPYDPDRRAERQAFVRGVDHLAALGILLRRTSDDAMLRQWEEAGTGVGAGYEIDRDALLQFSDPYTVELAFRTDDGTDVDDDGATSARTATRSQRMLRTLVEDTALLYADLHAVDADYARGQRSWLAGHAADMTGGSVEIREEGMLLRLPEDRPASAAATVVFPVATAPSWFALKTLDAAMSQRAPAGSGVIALSRAEIESVAEQVYWDNHGALTIALKESPARMLAVVERTLVGAGLIRLADGRWTILPVAARYRDPKAVWEQTLEEQAP
jgi:uncharacterized protein (TIGR02678 family)